MKHATVLLLSAILVCAVSITIAHDATYTGTVMTVEPGKIGKVKVSVIDEETKQATEMVFEIDDATKILRGDVVVKFAEASIQKGEQIAVTVNDDESDTLAEVIRLLAKK